MSRECIIFFVILAANTIISLLFTLWGMVFKRYGENDTTGGRKRYLLLLVFFLLCPVVGLLSYGLGYLFNLIFFHKEADLSDVVFSKDRTNTYEFVDMERERNMASFEESIAVSDFQSLRGLMLNVLRGDVKKSLNSIALGLNSQDSETSHYAATALRDELGDFRNTAQKIYLEIQKKDDNCVQYCEMEIEYMNQILLQDVLTEMEQTSFVNIFENVGQTLYLMDKKHMKTSYYQWIIKCLVKNKQYDKAKKWCERAIQECPDNLFPHKYLLRTYYEEQDRDNFFAEMNALKNSSIVLDNDTLEIIRTFS